MGFTTRHTVVIRIDRTPPSVSGTPARPPDHNGWFNHPVSISFVGSDTTSGVAGCDHVSYAGPEGEGVAAPGSCTDVAGNVGTGAFSLNYDATRPRAPEVHAIPGRKRVRLEWSGPEDAPTVEVIRIAPRRKLVYRGTASRAVDRRLRNGVRYRYRVTAIDRAGNRASATARATPTTSALLLPARGGRLSSPPLLAWKKVKAARYYNVQLFRGTRKVVTEFPRSNRLQLRRSWRFEGGRRRLVPGNYTWYVWAVVSEADARLLGSRSFTVTR